MFCNDGDYMLIMMLIKSFMIVIAVVIMGSSPGRSFQNQKIIFGNI